MNLEDLSIRLGMQHGLYIGICIGVILTSLIILTQYFALNGGISHILAVALALTCAGILVIGIILMIENKEFCSSGFACTCRYRSSLEPYCSHCALASKEQKTADEKMENKDNTR